MKPEQFSEIIKKGYSLDLIYILSIVNTSGLDTLRKDSLKIDNLYKTIIRKDLFSENTEELTQTGKELLEFYNSNESTLKIVKKTEDSDFEKWWKTYPKKDGFTYKNKSFDTTRSLSGNKKTCKLKFDKILNEGVYTVEQLIKGIETEVILKKEASIKTNKNHMTFMKNVETYLNSDGYKVFIEIAENGELKISKNVGSTDI